MKVLCKGYLTDLVSYDGRKTGEVLYAITPSGVVLRAIVNNGPYTEFDCPGRVWITAHKTALYVEENAEFIGSYYVRGGYRS